MKTFYCDACGALVFLENVSCLSRGHALGFLPDIMDVAALELDGEGGWKSLADVSQGRRYRACANGPQYSVCNWFIPIEAAHEHCAACRLNPVVPDLHPFVLSNPVLQKLRLVHEVRPHSGNSEKTVAAVARPIRPEVSLA